jgi:large subunit ribosomal protein L21
MYAIIRCNGKQYRVTPGDVVDVDRLSVEDGAEFDLTDILAVSANGELTLGQPTVGDAAVSAELVQHLRGKKVVVFKKKRRKGYSKKQGHRQELSRIRIQGISLAGKALEEAAVAE